MQTSSHRLREIAFLIDWMSINRTPPCLCLRWNWSSEESIWILFHQRRSCSPERRRLSQIYSKLSVAQFSPFHPPSRRMAFFPKRFPVCIAVVWMIKTSHASRKFNIIELPATNDEADMELAKPQHTLNFSNETSSCRPSLGWLNGKWIAHLINIYRWCAPERDRRHKKEQHSSLGAVHDDDDERLEIVFA